MCAADDIRGKDHAYNVGIAVDFGIPAALLYHDIDYWCTVNAAQEYAIHDGCTWMFQSVDGFHERFPELAPNAIRSALRRLEDAGLIIVGNYNRLPIDRTKWYTTQISLYFPHTSADFQKSTNGLQFSENGLRKSTNGLWVSGNGLQKSEIAIADFHKPLQPINNKPIKESEKESNKEPENGTSSPTQPPRNEVLQEDCFSSPHLKVIKERTIDFNPDKLSELISLGDSVVNIALALYPCKKPMRWEHVYQMRLKNLTDKSNEVL